MTQSVSVKMSSYSNYSLRKFSLIVKHFIRLIGFGTFSVKNDKVYITISDLVWLVFNILFASFVFYLSLTLGLEQNSKSSKLLALGIVITMTCGSLVSITSMICVFFNRHRIWEVIVTLDDLILKFRTIHVYPNFKRYIIMFAIFTLISIFLIALGVIVMAIFFGYYTKPGYLVIYGYLSTSFSSMMGWSSMFHLAIYLRLNLINQTIR